MNLDGFKDSGYKAITRSYSKDKKSFDEASRAGIVSRGEALIGVENEDQLVSLLKSGVSVRVGVPLSGIKEGVLCMKWGRVMLEIPPMQNGRSPLYVFALRGSAIHFDDLVFL